MVTEELKQIIDKWGNRIINIEEKMESKKTYKKFYKEVYGDITSGFEVRELRTCPVHFRFHEDDEIKTVQLRHFLTNLIFWEPMISLNITRLTDDYVVDCTKISSNYIKKYIDEKIVIPYKHRIENTKMNIIIHDLIHNLGMISEDFNIILGMTINIESFIDLSKRNERFNQIIRTKIPDNMQP